MTSKLRDFNLLKVADVSSNSTTTNSVSVVVNADTSGNSQNTNNNDSSNVNFTPPTLTQPIYPPAATIDSQNVNYASSASNQAQQQVQELQSQLIISENELKFYKLLSATLSNILKDNNMKLLVNLIDQTGKIVIEAPTLIELIAIKTNTDPNVVNITYKDEEPTCMNKVSPIKQISNIKINDETFQLKYNREFNILQDTYNISLEKCIIPIPISYSH